MSPAEKIDEWQRSVEGMRALDALAWIESFIEDRLAGEDGGVLDPEGHLRHRLGTLEAFIRAQM